MSFVEASSRTRDTDEFSDAVASILQEQLAPIVETLREHARLLDLHSALLNHSTAMNRYNVGKTDDIRDFQNNVNYKLQFYIHPEDRWHPSYRNPRSSASTSTETQPYPEPRLPTADALTQADEPTYSTASSSSSVATSPGSPDRSLSPVATEHADSRPTTPRQQLGDGFSVVPGPSHRLQRERPFSVAPDPMWNSSRDIRPYETLAMPAPPPPYVQPPTYAEVVPSGQIEVVEQVVLPEPSVEIIEIGPSILQPPTLDVRNVSVTSNIIPLVPVTEEEELERNTPSYSFGPSWTSMSHIQVRLEGHTASENEDVAYQVDPNDEDDVGSTMDENLNVESQLSEKARGKKRMREEDYSSDEDDDSETLEYLLREGCSSPSPSTGNSDRDGPPDRKRMKMDWDTTDTMISADRLEVDEPACKSHYDVESWGVKAKKLRDIEKLYRSGRLLL